MEKPQAARAGVFEENYRHYLKKLAKIDLAARAATLDIAVEDGAAQVSFFGRPCKVSARGIADADGNPAPYDVCVVLARYLLLCPKRLPVHDDWTAYRDFKEAGPLTAFFADAVEGAVASAFAGRPAALEAAGKALGGVPPLIRLSYDLVLQVPALPRVPLLLLFNDADEDFAARCSVLFEARADRFLDAESLAILGSQLAYRLSSHG